MFTLAGAKGALLEKEHILEGRKGGRKEGRTDSWVSYMTLFRVFVRSLPRATCDCGISTASLSRLGRVKTSLLRW